MDIALKAAEIFGKEIGKSLLPRLNWLKGEEAFMGSLGRAHSRVLGQRRGRHPG